MSVCPNHKLEGKYVIKMSVCDPVCVSLWKGLKNQVQVKMNIVSCPPVTTVLIKRPDLKYQLGFSVQNGIVSTTQGPLKTQSTILCSTFMMLGLIHGIMALEVYTSLLTKKHYYRAQMYLCVCVLLRRYAA